ncbi:hypothetical protein ACLOAV_004600 [Pseudogymnoascus australis]
MKKAASSEFHHVEEKNQAILEALGVAGNSKNAKVISVALADAIAKDKPPTWSKSMAKLYGIMVIVTMNDCMNGYDGSLMGSLNSMDPFHNFFNVGMEGSSIGLVFAIYTVGSIIGSLFAATACDLYGRRFGMFSGSCFIVLGTVLEATAHALTQFMGGRFLIGFGVTIATTAAPVYLVEIAYPTWRGRIGGLYNVVGYYVGAIVATWTSYATGHLTSNWSWRIPVILQAIPCILVMLIIWTLPESPRWLYLNGKPELARAILIKYHGDGKPDSAIAELEFNEMEHFINTEIETSDKRWWDYRPLFNSRPALYRIWLVLLVTVFCQFIGGAVIGYYMSIILENIGITSSSQQLLLNALNMVFSFVSGIFGSLTVDKFGRRSLLLWGTFLTMLCYIPINVLAAKADGHITQGAGYAFVAMIFLYGIFWSFTYTPLQALYPAEVLNNEIRGKGMAFMGFVSGVASFINTYATPVALKNIGWKTYTIFLILHAVQWLFMYLTVVETAGRSLEEIEEIFQDAKPVQKSLQRHNVIVTQGLGVSLESS